jgi:hypothetical protein
MLLKEEEERGLLHLLRHISFELYWLVSGAEQDQAREKRLLIGKLEAKDDLTYDELQSLHTTIKNYILYGPIKQEETLLWYGILKKIELSLKEERINRLGRHHFTRFIIRFLPNTQ